MNNLQKGDTVYGMYYGALETRNTVERTTKTQAVLTCGTKVYRTYNESGFLKVVGESGHTPRKFLVVTEENRTKLEEQLLVKENRKFAWELSVLILDNYAVIGAERMRRIEAIIREVVEQEEQ